MIGAERGRRECIVLYCVATHDGCAGHRLGTVGGRNANTLY